MSTCVRDLFCKAKQSQVTYGKCLLINMQTLGFGAYLPEFTS